MVKSFYYCSIAKTPLQAYIVPLFFFLHCSVLQILICFEVLTYFKLFPPVDPLQNPDSLHLELKYQIKRTNKKLIKKNFCPTNYHKIRHIDRIINKLFFFSNLLEPGSIFGSPGIISCLRISVLQGNIFLFARNQFLNSESFALCSNPHFIQNTS